MAQPRIGDPLMTAGERGEAMTPSSHKLDPIPDESSSSCDADNRS
jgi:hypothetical protein